MIRSTSRRSAGGWLRASFRSLRSPDYRLWAGGALFSNIGTWVDRTAQDWLVLTELTRHSASAVGIVMALQFGPQLLFLPWIGLAADTLDRRKLVMATQAISGTLALALGILTLTGSVQLWHVYVLAFLSGSAAAFDGPARQTFVNDLVGDDDLANAVALNSISFNAGRMIGPAVAGLLIALWGTGWAFLVNGLSFFLVLGSLFRIRPEHHNAARRARPGGALMEGFRYIVGQPELMAMMGMLFAIGMFGLNFAIFISTMSATVFGMGAGRYGLLTSMMAIGTMFGALLAAGRGRPTLRTPTIAAAIFAGGMVLAAVTPNYWLFGAILIPVGMATMTFINSSNTLMQLAAQPTMRGRVLAIRLAVMSGVTLVGAPLVGAVADGFGPRPAIALGAVSGLVAAAIGFRHLARENAQRRTPAPAADLSPPPEQDTFPA